MYIKQVVIDGFKSYAQRTEIVGFDPLFNAITGLNGSGKSNILDAICFLLGISNLSQVRASNLQELVYKSGQAGITKATVTITFDNSDKKQSPLGYETYDEITVSRQIVIGGRNKYLINGSNATPSRVQDLFRSVQLNVNNPHFLIMQGRITKVLNMKPPEILAMIEEAAGTRMYESKRAAAQKTIEKKDSKLKEIETILEEEITPTLRKLKEERSSYLEYQKVVRELEHLSRLTVAFQFAEAEKCCKQSSTELEGMKAEIEGHKSQIAESDVKLQELDEAKKELEAKQSEESSGPIQELEKKLDDCAKTNALAEATLKNSKDSLANEQKVFKGLKKGFDEDQSMLETKSAELKAMEGAHTDLHDRSKAAEKAVLVAQHHFQAVTAGLSSNADGQDETLAAQKIACENDISTALSEKKQAEMRLKGAQSEIKERERAFKDSEHSLDGDKAALSAIESSIAKIEQAMGKMDYRDGLEEELIAKRDRLTAEVSELRRKIGDVESRFPQLQFEYQDPVPGFNREKVKGPVAKLVRVKDMSAATALEVAAGGKLYNIVVDNEHTGKQLLEKGRLKRRFTIIPLNRIAGRSINDGVVRKAQSLIGRDKVHPAISLVGYEDELQPAMEYVFGSTFVCDTLQNAKKVTFDKQVSIRSVSLAGDVFDPSGTLSGGSRPQTAPILTRLQELLECEQLLEAKSAELEVVVVELQSVQKVSGRYKELKEQREAKSHDLELISTRINQSSHHQQLVELQALKDTVAHQKELLKATEETEKRAKQQLQDIQKKMKESKSHQERELKEAEQTLAQARQEAEGVVKEAKAREQEVQALRLEVEELQKGLQAQQEQIGVCQQSITVKSHQLEEHSLAEANAKSALKSAKQELEQQKANLKQMNKELQKLEAQWKDVEKEKATHIREIKELEHNIAKFQRDCREAAQRVEDLLAKHDWIATEKHYFGKANTAYDFGAYNLKEATRKLSRLQEEKDTLSKNVNMRAMNMLGKAEEKYNDLMKKKSIVENDKSKIGELIVELDQKKNEALKGAHQRVNQDFGSIFSTLLPGASAKLSPSEGMTVLDGLEVKVAFGGVWKESLTELSGGQRSLVALSLILSLLLFKPAPLYILDEIDAALDLSHTQNIGQMLRTHFRHSQFIVVSLKDGMFNNANVLFKTKFIDGVSAVTRYVNPRALTHRSDEGENSGVSQEGQEKRGAKKPAKRARIDAPLTEVATPLPAH